MESRRVGNCLDVFRRVQIGISSGDCRKLPTMQVRHCLWKYDVGLKVGVMKAGAVTSPPAGIESELHKVGKPELSARARGSAARQSAERFEIYSSRSLGDQVCVKESEMGVLILGIIMDVLVHIPIKDFQGLGVGWIPGSSRDFVVWDASELVVLDPEIGLEDFGRRREPEQSRVS
jgi:hypothetical protein